MGFFGGLWGKVKETVKKAGKDKFEEAERLYEEITERYNRKRREFNSRVDRLVDSIEAKVNNINKAKDKIKNELFVEMATNLEKIKDVEIDKNFKVEEYKKVVYSFDSVRSKSELYKIDFNKNKFKVTVQAIFTLGFYTRKKAKETLYAVQEEEYKIDCEISKMEAELKKLRSIEQSLTNVEYYFNSLIEIYESLLVRLDNSVNYLYFRCLQFAHKIVSKGMSIKLLPKIQQKEIEAIITTSTILKVMTETQIVSLEAEGKMKKYEEEMKNKHCRIIDTYNAA